ncbi:MAG: 5-methyltetrahydropteroyltriglutamate--homocysteine S-methyltransferase [Aquificaceae bacterium]
MKTFAFGYPKLGEKREFKSLVEDYWKGKISEEDLLSGINLIERSIANTYKAFVDFFPAGEVSLYDFVLDSAIGLGVIPDRFKPFEGLRTYFKMARGKGALEMTKYFNTNYHYLVPELEGKDLTPNPEFLTASFKRLKDISGVKPKLIGPFTFLKLSKALQKSDSSGFGVFNLEPIKSKDVAELYLEPILNAYGEILGVLRAEGADLVIFEEPAFCMDLQEWEWDLISEIYQKLKDHRLWVLSYYDSVSDLKRFMDLPVEGIGLDFCSNAENLENLLKLGFSNEKTLIAGVINGRNVWRANLKEKLELIEKLSKISQNIVISNSCPLFHVPISVKVEDSLPDGLEKILAFAKEKLEELNILKRALEGEKDSLEELPELNIGYDQAVRERLKALKDEDFVREPYSKRAEIQKKILGFDSFPTTTIGSFPQTQELRKVRSDFSAGKISKEEYSSFVKELIKDAIKKQEELGLDALVHGEFERSDMVEFFAQRLKGVATTKHGWIISYGSRVYRPPIIYGDISRPEPMTLDEILYAQSLTQKPVKGMLTGPVTILNWSFVREDVPKEVVALELALAIHDEVKDLEEKGIKIIQIDEPAFREGAPLKKKDWPEYFRWAVKAFRLCSRAKPETQIHTHMCYSEFNDILEYIYELDFDVISIEASRSKGEILSAFENFKGWDRQIGIGVYDIHSPEIPDKEGMKQILKRAMSVLDKELLWVNPDCGLKTRNWQEVIPSLRNMVDVAIELRNSNEKRTDN